MKQYSILLTALALLIGLTACGNSAADSQGSAAAQTPTAPTSDSSPEATVPASEAPLTPENVPPVSSAAEASASPEAEDAPEEVFSLTLSGNAITCSNDTAIIDGSTVTITCAGSYHVTGTLEDGMIIVDAPKEDEVELCLAGVNIHAETSAAIYVRSAKKLKVKLEDGTVNTLTGGSSFVAMDENNIDAVVFSKDDLTLKGKGTLIIDSPGGHGIVSKDDLTVKNGTYEITALGHAISVNDSYEQEEGSLTLTTQKDGIHAENKDDDTLGSILITAGTLAIDAADDALYAVASLQIDGGSVSIRAAEGIESTVIQINEGTISINASDDGINAAWKSASLTPIIEINGGEITVVMGAGDTDGIDSNGDLIINGGTVDVTGGSTFDYDGTGALNGGTLIVNGQQVDSLPNQMMGGRGGMRGW